MTMLKEEPKTKATPEEHTDLIQSTSEEVEKLTKAKAFKLARKLIDDTEFNYFRLGGVLAVIHSNEYWKGDGHESFKDFVDAEFGMHPRKALHLISIYTNLVNSGVEWDSVKDVGWTKLKEIASLLTPENVEEWVQRAKDLTTLQLIEYIRAMNAGAEEGEPQETKATTVSTLTFKVHEDQKETIKKAVEKGRVDYGTEFDSVALENICLLYIGDNMPKAAPAKDAPQPTLLDLMKGKTPEEVLGVFEEVFPDVELEATLP
jgi:hypothetical protein